MLNDSFKLLCNSRHSMVSLSIPFNGVSAFLLEFRYSCCFKCKHNNKFYVAVNFRQRNCLEKL